MPSCEQSKESTSRQSEIPSGGVVFLLVSSLVHGFGLMAPSPAGVMQSRTVEAASVERAAALPAEKTDQTQIKSRQPVSHRSAEPRKVIHGEASWYGPGFHGRKTASGAIFDQNKLTAAHKTLPLGTKARVTNLENGSTVEVEINDRGPYVGQRVIDLSHAAADALGFVESGITLVQIELLPGESGTKDAG